MRFTLPGRPVEVEIDRADVARFMRSRGWSVGLTTVDAISFWPPGQGEESWFFEDGTAVGAYSSIVGLAGRMEMGALDLAETMIALHGKAPKARALSQAQKNEAICRIQQAVPFGYKHSHTDLITDLSEAIGAELDRAARGES